MIIEHKQLINCSKKKAFEFISNPENDKVWKSNILSSHIFSNSSSKQTQFMQEMRFMFKDFFLLYQLEIVRDEEFLIIRSLNSPFEIVQYIHIHHYIKSNSCMLRIRVEEKTAGIFKLIEIILKPLIKKQLVRDYKILSNHLNEVSEI